MIRAFQKSAFKASQRNGSRNGCHYIGRSSVNPYGSHSASPPPLRTFSTRIEQKLDEDVDPKEKQFSNSDLNRVLNKASHVKKSDRLIVVGSGVAGCAAALIAAETYGIPVTLLFAGNVPEDCNSFWAQGGIIYRNYDPASGDSADLLAQDIHRAGAGLCVDDAVRKVSEEGPDRVRQLLLDDVKKVFAQVPFDTREDGSLSLCLGKFHFLPIIVFCCFGRCRQEAVIRFAIRSETMWDAARNL
jgi:FAD binding domain